jgi:hypothetical protein
MDPKDVAEVSGHSIRVGAAQDLLALNIDLASVMQAGRWKSNRMPMRYGEHILAAKGGMGRAAQLQGRDESDPDTEVARMRGKAKPTSKSITLQELEQIITPCGGQAYAREYAAPLLTKIQVLEARGGYKALLEPIRTARDQADLRGRLLEVNLAYQFERAGVTPDIAAKQGGTGDIDFRFDVGQHEVFLECKLLQQDHTTTANMNAQLAATNTYTIARNSDVQDVFRLQRDLIEKANIKKFNTKVKSNWINLIAVDVSEIQLGTVDVFDCVLAAAGNSDVASLCKDPVRASFYVRSSVLGVFEKRSASMTPEQKKWTASVDRLVKSDVHPRDYIHGAVFLFRTPEDTAALVYDLRAVVVWNRAIMSRQLASEVGPTLYRIAPLQEPNHG